MKWCLWHGNVYDALEKLKDLEVELELLAEQHLPIKKFYVKLAEFITYIQNNRAFIVNYGDRYRNEETIASAFVESTVNEVISKRFVKKQQMRWTKKGVHILLQVRTRVLNEEWNETFERWYPEMANVESSEGQKKIA